MSIHELPRFEDETLMQYSFPGLYPIFYVCADSSALCPACANELERSNVQNLIDRGENWSLDSETLVTALINYEDDSLHCDNCSNLIECAYCEG